MGSERSFIRGDFQSIPLSFEDRSSIGDDGGALAADPRSKSSAPIISSSKRTRKETNELILPPKLPNVVHLHMWLANVSAALVEAAAYDDQVEIIWLRAVNDGVSTFESLESGGDARFVNLDMMLAIALNAKLDQGEFSQVVKKKNLRCIHLG